MNAAIVDTDVVSMLFKGDTRAHAYRSYITGRLLGISFMTLAELERWSLERSWGPTRRLDLAQHLTRYAVLPVSRELCGKWADVSFAAKRKGRPIQTADAWIAASALYYQVPLITNNRSDYAEVDGLVLLSAKDSSCDTPPAAVVNPIQSPGRVGDSWKCLPLMHGG